MNKVISIVIAAFAAFSLHAQSLPIVKVEDAAGKSVNTRSMIDGETPFILTFWASWCRPCRMELAALEEAAPDWEGDFPLRIYAVSIDDRRSIADARALAATSDWPVTVLFDTKERLAQAFGISSIPQVFIFDKDGKQVYTHVGYTPGSEKTLLKNLLKAK
ncbi:MAG: TlpA family protein disulfide reductase [Bacteroidales bacterium]|nr:TlpA family protein disulfide reductase [Bacteroidales bacterium]